MTKYYLHDGNQEQGPFDFEQLKLQNVKKETKIWHEGLENWTTVGEIAELKDLLIRKTPPPLEKPIEQAKPPKLEEIPPSYSNPTTFSEPIIEKKKSKLIPIIIISVLIIGGIAGWLIYQNVQNGETIESLVEKVSTQDETISSQSATISTQGDVLSQQSEADQERQRVNSANTQKNMNFRNNWQNYIKVDNSEPNVDYTLGGISEFSVFINNETSYMLDEVDVLVQYIRKNGNVYQTENVRLFNVSAGSSESVTAPSSVNGVKVSCSISKIVSRKMHFCYPSDNGNPEDPYFCK